MTPSRLRTLGAITVRELAAARCDRAARATWADPVAKSSESDMPESHRRGAYAAIEAPLTDLSPALHHVATRTSKTDRLRVRISDLRDVRDIQSDVDAAHQREKEDDEDALRIYFGALLALFLTAGGIVALALALALP